MAISPPRVPRRTGPGPEPALVLAVRGAGLGAAVADAGVCRAGCAGDVGAAAGVVHRPAHRGARVRRGVRCVFVLARLVLYRVGGRHAYQPGAGIGPAVRARRVACARIGQRVSCAAHVRGAGAGAGDASDQPPVRAARGAAIFCREPGSTPTFAAGGIGVGIVVLSLLPGFFHEAASTGASQSFLQRLPGFRPAKHHATPRELQATNTDGCRLRYQRTAVAQLSLPVDARIDEAARLCRCQPPLRGLTRSRPSSACFTCHADALFELPRRVDELGFER